MLIDPGISRGVNAPLAPLLAQALRYVVMIGNDDATLTRQYLHKLGAIFLIIIRKTDRISF